MVYNRNMILKRLGTFFLDILQVITFAIAIFLFIYLLVMQPHRIRGASMMPNFPDGEYLLTDKVSYRFNEPKRGDVVVFEAPNGNGDDFIKRIIGLPNDKIAAKGGSIFINGLKLKEPYLSDSIYTSAGRFLKEGDTVSVPEGQFFVLGDNRAHSSDSRAWGFVTQDKITGRAWFIYWPLDLVGVIEAVDYSF